MTRAMSFYEVLDVKSSASAEEIRAAYRRAARAVHPDRAEGADRFFLMVQEAYEVLGDPARRQRYDNELRRGGSPQSSASPPPPPPPQAAASSTTSSRPTSDAAAGERTDSAEKRAEGVQEARIRPRVPAMGSTAALGALWALLSGFLVFEFAAIGRAAAVVAAAYVVAAAAALWTGWGRVDLLVRASWALTVAWALVAAISWAMGRSWLVAGVIGAALAGWAIATTVLARRRRAP